MNKCPPPDSVASAIVKEYLAYKEHGCRQTYNADNEEEKKTSMAVTNNGQRMTAIISRYRDPNTYRAKAKQPTQITPSHITSHVNGWMMMMMMMRTMKMTEAVRHDVAICKNHNNTVGD